MLQGDVLLVPLSFYRFYPLIQKFGVSYAC